MEQVPPAELIQSSPHPRADEHAENLDLVFSSIIDPVFIFNFEGRLVRANPAGISLLGFDPTQKEAGKAPELEEVIRRLSLHRPEGTPARWDELPSRRALRGERVENEVFSFVTSQGITRTVAVTASPLIAGGRIRGAVSVWNDITERANLIEKLSKIRVHLEERVLERTAKLREQAELLDLASNAIIVRTVEGVITFWNNGAAEMYGWTKEEALGKIARDLLETQFPIPRDEIMVTFLRDGRWQGALTHRRKDGSPIHVLSRWTLRRDGEGNPQDVILISHDITERVKLEEQLRQTQKLEALGTLAGGIAHDFNNLLMPIMINTDLALLDIQEETLPSPRHLQLVKESAKRGQDLVKQIITFSRQKEQPRRAIEITPILKETLKFLKATIPSTITIEERLESQSMLVMADPTQIHQVLMNLCSNSAQAMKEEGGTLEIRLDRLELDERTAPGRDLKPGQYLCLTVRDTGPGMKPEIRERAFDPFFTTKKSGEGTGMGLAVVHGIVKNHEGVVHLESEEGKGTTVTVFFPVFQGGPKKREVLSLEPFPAGYEKILLVDDEEIQVSTMQNMLERCGYRVAARTDPRQALQDFRSRPDDFDLIITDQVMPHLSGDRLARECLLIRPGIPVILCTGFSETVDEHEARSLGIREFIMKPFNFRDVVDILRRVLPKK